MLPLGSLLAHDVFEARTATRSELFDLTCLHITTHNILVTIFSLVKTISLKIWKRPLCWNAKCYQLPISIHGSQKKKLPLLKSSIVTRLTQSSGSNYLKKKKTIHIESIFLYFSEHNNLTNSFNFFMLVINW